MSLPERSVLLATELQRRILVLDGAMGTMIQARGLTADDFGGARYEGCNEHLNLTRPDRKSTRLNSSHIQKSRMPSSA